LALPTGSQLLLRWAQGPLLVPCRLDTSAYKLQAKTKRRVCIYALPCALCLRTLPPCRGGLQCYHVPHGSGPRLPTQEGYGAATCHTAPDPASLLGKAPVLPCATQLRNPFLCSGGLRCCHVAHNSGPCLPTQEGSGAAACPMTLDLASLLRGEGLRCCHMSCDPQRVTSLKNKESLSCNGIQQGSHVSKTRLCVTEVPTRRAGRRYSTTL
jgi:hypothetical protein